MLEPEQIEAQWLKYRSLMQKLGERAAPVNVMLDELEERLALAPASSKSEHHNAFAGGLVDHSLRVLQNVMTMSKAFGWTLPKDSMILTALTHDLGKVGSYDADMYVPQTDKWRNDKLGELYTFNKDLQYMTVPDRSLFLLQHYGIKLTMDEHIAIRIHDGLYVEENAPYKFKEPMLAQVIHFADLIACKQEKGILP